MGLDDLHHRVHLIAMWQSGAQRLFHRRDHHPLDAIGLERGALAVVAMQRDETIHAHFGTFLHCPFDAVQVLGRRYSQYNLVTPRRGYLDRLDNLNTAALGVSQRDAHRVAGALTVDNLDEVALGQAQHLHGMPRLVLTQCECPCDVWLIEPVQRFRMEKLF